MKTKAEIVEMVRRYNPTAATADADYCAIDTALYERHASLDGLLAWTLAGVKQSAARYMEAVESQEADLERDLTALRSGQRLTAASVLSPPRLGLVGLYRETLALAQVTLHRTLAAYESDAPDTVPVVPVVKWIVTDGNDPNVCADGELGVEVNGAAYLYHKRSLTLACDSDVKYRPINKREFGEVIRRPGAVAPEPQKAPVIPEPHIALRAMFFAYQAESLDQEVAERKGRSRRARSDSLMMLRAQAQELWDAYVNVALTGNPFAVPSLTPALAEDYKLRLSGKVALDARPGTQPKAERAYIQCASCKQWHSSGSDTSHIGPCGNSGFRGVGRKDPAHDWREVSEPEK